MEPIISLEQHLFLKEKGFKYDSFKKTYFYFNDFYGICFSFDEKLLVEVEWETLKQTIIESVDEANKVIKKWLKEEEEKLINGTSKRKEKSVCIFHDLEND